MFRTPICVNNLLIRKFLYTIVFHLQTLSFSLPIHSSLLSLYSSVLFYDYLLSSVFISNFKVTHPSSCVYLFLIQNYLVICPFYCKPWYIFLSIILSKNVFLIKCVSSLLHTSSNLSSNIFCLNLHKKLFKKF